MCDNNSENFNGGILFEELVMPKKSGRCHTPSQRPKLFREKFSLNDSVFKWTFENCLWDHEGWEDLWT